MRILEYAPIEITRSELKSCREVTMLTLWLNVVIIMLFLLWLVAYLPSYHEKAIKTLQLACLGVASHLSTTPRRGNPAKCLSQRRSK